MRKINLDPAVITQCIQQTRLQADLSKAVVAERMGTSENIVEKWESGKRLMDFAELRRYCRAIGISMDDFINRLEATLKSVLLD